MQRLLGLLILTSVLLLGVDVGSWAGAGTEIDRADRLVPDPMNATYRIDDQPIALEDGRRESPAAPGSAMKNRTTVWRRPVHGDLDGDGDEDAIVVLNHDAGGSGTFYYVAAAINANGRYRGSNTVLLGDRFSPVELTIRNLRAVVNYIDRRPEEPFHVKPSIDRSMTLSVNYGQLLKTTSSGDPEKVIRGWLTIGHEVRSFKPCDGENDLWLMGQSPALKAIIAAYRRALPDQKDYGSLLMVLAGKQVEPPTDGFGANYEAAFLATRLVRIAPEGDCSAIHQVPDSKTSILQKCSFDFSTLDEKGLLGPPGAKWALSYEFCIPNEMKNKTEVERIDPTVRFFSESPGRIGCGSQEMLCIGSTHQEDFINVLRNLVALPYVKRIEQSYFE